MAHIEGHEDMHGFVKRWNHSEDGFQHWKYPETVGNDTRVDNISFNSHQSSEYAIERMDNISETTHEPFVMFEMMAIDEKIAQGKIEIGNSTFKKWFGEEKNEAATTTRENASNRNNLSTVKTNQDASGNIAGVKITGDETDGWFRDIKDVAQRKYTGSIALYMPTDIQVNDTMMYNENSRKLGAAIQGMLSSENDTEIMNWTVLTDPTVLATAAGIVGMTPIPIPAAVGVIIGGGVGTILQKELQRNSGKVMNPNEILQYSQTALRSFTFNWVILPDNEDESEQATGLIKFFRKSAHAKKTSSTLVTVPDHVITSFHGAKDMIQLPPCFIESVNVTYNPNNSSFFRRNNSPVEIGLAITLKEIVPIYAADVERGL